MSYAYTPTQGIQAFIVQEGQEGDGEQTGPEGEGPEGGRGGGEPGHGGCADW